MSTHKITPFLSDIKTFFKKSDKESQSGQAMETISYHISDLRMTERHTLGVESKRNHIFRLLAVFQYLLLFPCFGIKNVFQSRDSVASSLMAAHKDVFYRFLENPAVRWRKAMWSLSRQLWDKIRIRSDHKCDDTCLVIDDTDFPKTGRRIENIGKVFSHTEHRCILGFKALFMAVSDGVSQLLLDFALVGEKGRKGDYGIPDRAARARRKPKRDETEDFKERLKEYSMSKIDLAIEMIRRAISHKVKFSYVLADSWFTCAAVIRFIHSRHIRAHWLGMIKVGEKGRTKYRVDGKDMTAPALVRQGLKGEGKRLKRCRKLKCQYMVYDGMYDGIPVRIFLIRRTNSKTWNGLLTTDTKLSFEDAWRIYARRWSIEVIFKDCKTYLGLGKCQSTNFATQIGATTVSALQYNILSLARRFADYETIGELFRDATRDCLQLSVAQQILGCLQELVEALVEVFAEIDEEQIYHILFNRTEKIAHLLKFFDLNQVS